MSKVSPLPAPHRRSSSRYPLIAGTAACLALLLGCAPDEPGILTPVQEKAEVNFGPVLVGGTSVRRIPVRVTDGDFIDLADLRLEGRGAGDFAAVYEGLEELRGDRTARIKVLFSPSGRGRVSAKVRPFLSAGTPHQQNFPLQLTGRGSSGYATGDLARQGRSEGTGPHDFGEVALGEGGEPFVFSVRNSGDQRREVLFEWSFRDPQFSFRGDRRQKLEPGEVGTVTVHFEPQESGTQSAGLRAIAVGAMARHRVGVMLTGRGIGDRTPSKQETR